MLAAGCRASSLAIIADLVRRKASVIAATSTPAAEAAKAASTTMPVVFTTSGDPIRLGLVSSLNQPGGNFTGIISMNVELASERLQLMHEALPNATICFRWCSGLRSKAAHPLLT